MIKKCGECGKNIKEWDEIVATSEEIYHTDCVEVYSGSYFVMKDGEFLGEVELGDEGDSALFILDEGEYEEDE